MTESIQKYEEALFGVNAECKKLLEKNYQLENELKKLSLVNSDLVTRFNSLKSKLDANDKDEGEEDEESAAKSEKIAQLQKQNKSLEDKCGELEKNLAKANQIVEKMKEQETELRECCGRLNHKIIYFEANERKLDDTLFDLKKENSELKTDLMTLLKREQVHKQELSKWFD